MGVDATRAPSFLLAKPEKRRLPRWVLPDDLTLLGVLAAIGIRVARQRSNGLRASLWVAVALLGVRTGASSHARSPPHPGVENAGLGVTQNGRKAHRKETRATCRISQPVTSSSSST